MNSTGKQSQKGKRVAAYARSARKSRNGEIDDQLARCSEEITNHGGTISAAFIDNGFSGATTKRPSFEQMMSQVRERRLDVIVVDCLDRMSRNLWDFAVIMKELARYDVELRIASHNERRYPVAIGQEGER